MEIILGAIDYTDEDMPRLFKCAKSVIFKHKRCSFSLIQKKLMSGYIMTGKILDMLEKDGIIGPENKSRSRKVLRFS